MTSSNIYNKDDVIVDPRLDMPIEVIGVRAGIPEEIEFDVEEPSEASDETEVFDEVTDYANEVEIVDEFDDDNYQILPPPEMVSVISQTVRISPGGTHVVDLVLEVNGQLDQFQCEVRATKI